MNEFINFSLICENNIEQNFSLKKKLCKNASINLETTCTCIPKDQKETKH